MKYNKAQDTGSICISTRRWNKRGYVQSRTINFWKYVNSPVSRAGMNPLKYIIL